MKLVICPSAKSLTLGEELIAKALSTVAMFVLL